MIDKNALIAERILGWRLATTPDQRYGRWIPPSLTGPIDGPDMVEINMVEIKDAGSTCPKFDKDPRASEALIDAIVKQHHMNVSMVSSYADNGKDRIVCRIWNPDGGRSWNLIRENRQEALVEAAGLAFRLWQ